MRLARSLLLAISLALASPAVSAFDSADEAALLKAAQSVVDAQIRFDVATLAAVLAPDYLEVSPVGDVDARDEVLGFYSAQAREQMRAAGMEPVSAALSDVRAAIDGDHARVIALNTATLKLNGAGQQRSLRAVLQFRRIDGAWKLASAVYVPYKPKPR